MTGTPHGRAGIFLASGVGTEAERTLNLLTSAYDAIKHIQDTYGTLTIIATNSNNGGNGFNFHDEANPTGENAFFVFRMPLSGARAGWTYEVLVQGATSSNFGSAPGNPGLANGSASFDGLAISAGVARTSGDADTSAWNGTTNNDFLDTKGDPVWATPAGGTMVSIPRSNSAGGTHATSAENCGKIVSDVATVNDVRMHISVDEDCVAFIVDKYGTHRYDEGFILAPYTPDGDYPTPPPYPLVGIEVNANMWIDSFSDVDAGAAGINPSNGVSIVFGQDRLLDDTDYKTNKQLVSQAYNSHPLRLYSSEPGAEGLLGEVDSFVQATFAMVGGDTADSNSKLVVANVTANVRGYLVPFDGVSDPKAMATGRDGSDW